MVLNGNECSNALYNANHRELHVSSLMGFCLYQNHKTRHRRMISGSTGMKPSPLCTQLQITKRTSTLIGVVRFGVVCET